MKKLRNWLCRRWLNYMCRQDGGHKTSDSRPDLCDRCGLLDADGQPLIQADGTYGPTTKGTD